MTEDQAKTKWCPFAQTVRWTETMTANRQRNGCAHDDCLCLASACMAWRWRQLNDHSDGYCGLAGTGASS